MVAVNPEGSIEAESAARPPSRNDVGDVWLSGEPGLSNAAVALGQCMVVYYGVAAFLHFVVPAVVATRNIQKKGKQKPSDTLRDAARSFPPILVKSLTLFAVEWLHYKGYGVLNNNSLLQVILDPVQLLQAACMIMLLDLFHDMWFYFTHRLLHTRWMLRNVHYIHHQSTNPSAFTGYSFHCVEAAMVFSVAIAEMFIFPIPMAMHRVYETWMIAIHVGGHCGYEMTPFVPHLVQVVALALVSILGVDMGSLTSVINNVEHHDMHHQHPKYHFSLYFTHWDYWLGSMHPDYVRKHPRWARGAVGGETSTACTAGQLAE